ncbi:MAG TPA: hypothetical protein VIN61_05380 [Gammaproteobacteria bacterium]
MAVATSMRLRSLATSQRVVALLAALLLAAEALVLVHRLDVDAHASDAPCKICLTVGAFDGAVTPSMPLLTTAVVPQRPAQPRAPRAGIPPRAPLARGPPFAS